MTTATTTTTPPAPYAFPTGLFINNEYVPSKSGKTFPTYNPSSNTLIAHVAEGDAADIDAAVLAAQQALPKWKKTPGQKRAAVMLRLASLIETHVDELAEIESRDNGMPVLIATSVIGNLITWLRYFAGYADKLSGRTTWLPQQGQWAYTLPEPIGIVGAIVPWNFPLTLATWKLAPALACGNCVIIKPSEKTPLSALRLAGLAAEAGLPRGVLGVIPGYGPTAGAALAHHNHVGKITFTGSVAGGKAVMKAAAASNLKRVTLELGGKSALIICEDYAHNLDHVAEIAAQGIFLNQGQFCAAASRVFVHEAIYDKFVEIAVEKARERLESLGDAGDQTTLLGPLVDQIQYEKVYDFVKSGVKEGARLAFGGKKVERQGFFLEPTVFADVQDHMSIAKEEIFGPVQSILKFKDLKEAIHRANNTPFGLAASVFTNDVNKAHAIAAELEAGTVWINTYGALYPQTPFGGYKQSGIGRENGEEVLKEYLNIKTVLLQNSVL